MIEPRWIDKRAFLLLHDEDLSEHGGLPGVRDEGLLDSALARPLNLLAYGDTRAWRNLLLPMRSESPAITHSPMRNRRAALLATGIFLGINGISFRPDKVDAYRVYFALAAGEVSEKELALDRPQLPQA